MAQPPSNRAVCQLMPPLVMASSLGLPIQLFRLEAPFEYGLHPPAYLLSMLRLPRRIACLTVAIFRTAKSLVRKLQGQSCQRSFGVSLAEDAGAVES